MLTLQATVVKDARPAYRPYVVTVSAIQRLSPHFVRVTFAADELRDFGTDGLDQRVKLVFPLEDGPQRGSLCDVGADDSEVLADGTWYARWRELPDELRGALRTYTVRAVRPELAEIDVDMVSHADGGPASRWLNAAHVGSPLLLVGPDARSIDSALGIDWHPGAANEFLLMGDETAAPAICSILESLPAGTSAQAFIEVPSASDALEITTHGGVSLTWLARDEAPHGSLLAEAVRGWVAQHPRLVARARAPREQKMSDLDVDSEMLWDSPERAEAGFYGWLAGEASAIKALRRYLVSETGIDRKRVAFMGYWRLGKSELQ